MQILYLVGGVEDNTMVLGNKKWITKQRIHLPVSQVSVFKILHGKGSNLTTMQQYVPQGNAAAMLWLLCLL